MSVKTRQNRQSGRFVLPRLNLRRLLIAMLLCMLALYAAPSVYRVSRSVYHRADAIVQPMRAWLAPQKPVVPVTLAPLFRPEVIYWESDILRWAQEYNVEPNLVATVMQIESCGHPTVSSYAGAQGLFQVMPFHFAENEDMLDPDTNALRGVNYIGECLRWADGDVGLALACYNGGPRTVTDIRYWDQQVHSYYRWGTAIYADALVQKSESETLNRWLAAGGQRLCDSAASEIGLR